MACPSDAIFWHHRRWPSGGHTQRILVVDDDPTVTNVLRRGLSYDGYIVDTAATGRQALTVARDHTPDLVILDLMLPELDGFDARSITLKGG